MSDAMGVMSDQMAVKDWQSERVGSWAILTTGRAELQQGDYSDYSR